MPSTQIYGTVADLRARIERTRGTDDVWLLQLLTAASRSIDNACNRRLDGFVTAAVATARTFPGSGLAVQRIDECTSATLVEVKDSPTDTGYTAWAATDWLLFRGDPSWPEFNIPPFDGLMATAGGERAVFTSGQMGAASAMDWAFASSRVPSRLSHNPRGGRAVPTVRVTARWGYADACPAEIHEAAIMQAARWYKRMQGAMSDTLADGELGMLLYQKSLDPDIRRILIDGRYVRATVGRK
jgi:hypothetical protein